ncbi:LTA synthase family protein [Halomarina pelagica]|uniref:LTA synthase family protein n=1 Tax=Halomarina pelagica TaxID=2961599 RepID=UPI0020C59DF2|nr:LTA synthase family protein [Halomarina sp. BND7]
MGTLSWTMRTLERLRSRNITALEQSGYELYQGLCSRTGALYQSHHPNGMNIYEEDWSVLIILDACRIDLIAELASQYDFLSNPGTFTSLGSSSEEWMSKNFTRDYDGEMANTVYISGNPFTDRVLDDDSFLVLDEVWRYNWDESLGTIRPRPITDRAITLARETNPDRMIVHYMQPHFPSIAQPDFGSRMDPNDFDGIWKSAWTDLQTGVISEEALWDAYLQNLHCVLDDVALLLANLDADSVVISADHGNAIGEWGLYGHPAHVPLPCLVTVPWYTTSSTDTGEYKPTTTASSTTGEVSDQLRRLGYL